MQLVRGLMLVVSSVVFVLALLHMQIAEVASIVFLAPIIVALAGGPLLGERVSPRTWLALAGGFTGVLLIIRPGGDAFTWWALLPLACAFMFAGYQILTRKLAGHDDPITTLFFPGLLACFVIPPVFPGAFDVPTVPLHAGLLGVIGILGAVGHFLLIRAHAPRAGDAARALRLRAARGRPDPRLARLRPAPRWHRPHRHRPHRRLGPRPHPRDRRPRSG